MENFPDNNINMVKLVFPLDESPLIIIRNAHFKIYESLSSFFSYLN